MLECKMPAIVSLGVLNVDFVMEVGKDLIGKKRLGKRISISAGGYGGCQAVAAVRCGVPTAAVGRVGTDIFSYQIEKTLREEQVDCQFLQETEGDNTGLSAIIAEEGKESVSIDFLGTNFQITKQDIDQCRRPPIWLRWPIRAAHRCCLPLPCSQVYRRDYGRRWTIWS